MHTHAHYTHTYKTQPHTHHTHKRMNTHINTLVTSRLLTTHTHRHAGPTNSHL